MKIAEYTNFDALKFAEKVIAEGIELDSFDVRTESEYGEVKYATATVTSQRDGTVYNLRYKLNGGGMDTECSCPACTQRRYFCKHQMALLAAVADHESAAAEAASIEAQIENERYAEFAMSYVAGGGLREDVSTAWYLWNQPA